MSKPLWTIPFVLQTTGISLLSWLAASLVDIYPSIKATKFLEVMGQKSLEVYLAAEILQEFVMYPGKRRGGGLWEVVVGGLQAFGVPRDWSCLLVSTVWAGLFTGVAYALDYLGWKIKL
jgi:predicted acyltransferase